MLIYSVDFAQMVPALDMEVYGEQKVPPILWNFAILQQRHDCCNWQVIPVAQAAFERMGKLASSEDSSLKFLY